MSFKDVETGRQVYCRIALTAASDLRAALNVTEDAFRHTSIALWRDPRPAFIYRVLDEVQKAGLCIHDWAEKLKDHKEASGADHLTRVATQWLQDEQSFRTRKLAETLVDLICFSTTNEADYYRDYLRLRELDESVRSIKDQNEFFGFKRRNTEYTIDWFAGELCAAEGAGFDVSKRWYLQDPGVFQSKWKTRGIPFSSFRRRYIHALQFATPTELAVVGKSYVHAYGMSGEVHFSPQEISSSFDADAVFLGLDRVGLLCFSILIRCQQLLNLVPAGANAELRNLHDENSRPAELVADLKTEKLAVGDFVWADGQVCEVVESKVSRYGYVSYLVRYIEQPPIPEIQEDWFAAFEVRLVATRQFAQEAMRQLQTEGNIDIDPGARGRFQNMSSEEANDLLRRAVAKLWRVWQQAKSQVKQPQDG